MVASDRVVHRSFAVVVSIQVSLQSLDAVAYVQFSLRSFAMVASDRAGFQFLTMVASRSINLLYLNADFTIHSNLGCLGRIDYLSTQRFLILNNLHIHC